MPGVLAGLVTAGIAIMYIMEPAQGTSNVDAGFFEVTYEAGIGLYVTAAGGAGVFTGSLIGLTK
ncbi:hypothetical protein [Halobacterium litoreum]|uniref:Uncharacterized protein n=1 Tax=Halobacterium litoreum TaxID=2039234 RepID=A0ABD5NAK2_9EURY|nr:hypothetical protein [Halobacterium litoreum]UHH14774.1 hypothetical protein LT972_07160 [Halobacterium litoreum]